MSKPSEEKVSIAISVLSLVNARSDIRLLQAAEKVLKQALEYEPQNVPVEVKKDKPKKKVVKKGEDNGEV